MTVADLQSALRNIDPSRQAVIGVRIKGKTYYYPVKAAAEQILAPAGTSYVALESPEQENRATVFVVEGA